MPQKSERVQILLKLFANFHKGMNNLEMETWEEFAMDWTVAQLEDARIRCCTDPNQKWAPSGWADFAKYLTRPAEQIETLSYGGGTFDGDWTKADTDSLLRACAATVAQRYEVPSRIAIIAFSRGLTVEDFEEGANAIERGAYWDTWLELRKHKAAG